MSVVPAVHSWLQVLQCKIVLPNFWSRCLIVTFVPLHCGQKTIIFMNTFLVLSFVGMSANLVQATGFGTP